jgi:hypothetical protein
MGKLSITARNELVDHIFNAAYTPASTLYLCLCTADPTESGTGASMNETANSAAYARAEIAFGSATGRSVTQDGQVNFPQATSAYSAPITHWAICDSGTYGAGNMLAFGSFVNSFTPLQNNIPYVADGEVVISFSTSTSWSTYAVHKLLDLMFNNVAYPTPSASIFVALLTAVVDVDDTDISTDATEEDATDYARTQVNPSGGSSPNWSTAVNGAIDNTGAIEIITNAEWTVDDWDTDVAMCIVDGASGSANIICFDNDNIIDQKPNQGDDVQFADGDLNIAIN